LIRKKDLLDILSKNDLKIFWTTLGERQIIGGDVFSEANSGGQKISGVYCLNETGDIEGSLKIKKIRC
jgi:hypothetical protein